MQLSNSLLNETLMLADSSLFDMIWPAAVVLLGGAVAAASAYAKSRLAKRLVPVKVRKHYVRES